MIAVDTSALIAIVFREASAARCNARLEAEAQVLISAGTVAEALLVATWRNVAETMTQLLDGFGFEVVPVTPATARRIGAAYARWGKGVHRAGLNFGDCFAYDVAMQHSCPLLFIGDDFARTDVDSAF